MRSVAVCLMIVCAIAAGESPRPTKPWEPHLAALTDERPAVHGAAIQALIGFGPQISDDLAVLQADADWRVRGRVVAVASGVGGDRARELVTGAAGDRQGEVRTLAALGLGRFPGAASVARLRELLQRDADPQVRIAAAEGLGDLGDPEGLRALAASHRQTDPAVRASMQRHLARTAARPAAVPRLAELMGEASGRELLALAEASAQVGDTRLAPALARLLAAEDIAVARAAARSLGVNGDGRALEALCVAATAGDRPLAEAATQTLRRLTGFQAGPGRAWTLWWQEHQAEVAARAARDELIARLHDPAAPVDAAELAAHDPAALWPLVEGFLGTGAPWWPARALAVLRVDAPARWTAPLADAIRSEIEPNRRLALIILLDELGDPAAADPLARLLADLERTRAERTAQMKGSQPERLALRIALERRGRR